MARAVIMMPMIIATWNINQARIDAAVAFVKEAMQSAYRRLEAVSLLGNDVS